MVAVARGEHVPLRAAKLDAGWEVDICLDREDGYWCEGVLKTEQYLTKEQYAPMLEGALARAEREHIDKVEVMREKIKPIGVDEAFKHDISKQPVQLPKAADNLDKASADEKNGSQASPTPPENSDNGKPDSRPSSVSIRTSRVQRPQEPVGRKFDWSNAPKARRSWPKLRARYARKGAMNE
jgi:hypothetical protein